jgi:O-antigen ligase
VTGAVRSLLLDSSANEAWRNRRSERVRVAVRVLAWIGLLLPSGVVEVRAPDQVVDDPFTPTTLFRGLLPLLCLALVLVIGRPVLRPVGSREWLVTGYLLVVFASAAWSLAPMSTLLKAVHLAAAYALLIVLARVWRSRDQALSDIACVVYGVVLLATATAVLAGDRSRDQYSGRLVAVFPTLQAVVLGTFAALALLLVVAGAGPRLLRTLWFRVPMAVCAVIVLLLTEARAAAVLAVLGPLAYAARRGVPTATRWWFAGAVGLGAALLVSPLGASLRARFPTSVDALTDFGGRVPLWQLAVEAVADRPLLGYGYFAGHRLGPYAELFYARVDPTQLPYVDGTWPETLLDLGLLGVAALLAVFVGCARHVIRGRSGDPLSWLHVCLVGFAVLYSVQDFTLQQVGYPLAVFGGVLLAPVRSQRWEPSRAAAP